MEQKTKSLKERSIAVELTNSYEFNHLKVIEELNELSLVLIHVKTKKHTKSPVPLQEVIDEIGDVKRKIWYLERIYGKNAIKKRIEEKVSHLELKKRITL